MGISAAVIFNSARDQLAKSAQNLQAIGEAKRKRQMEDDLFKLNKQKAETELEIMKKSGKTTDLQNQLLQGQIDNYFKNQNTINAGKTAMIQQAEHDEVMKARQAGSIAKEAEKAMVIETINPALAQAPGPNGGMVQGTDTTVDDTPEAIPSQVQAAEGMTVPRFGKGSLSFDKANKDQKAEFLKNRIGQLKQAGAPLTPDEQEYDFKQRHPGYNRGKVLNEARRIAIEEAKANGLGKDAPISIEDLKRNIPKAEELLYNESMSKGASSEPIGKIDQNISNDKVKVKDKNGKLYLLPKNQLEEAKKQGFTEYKG